MSKKTYLVMVDTYKGAKAPTTSRIEDAVKKCQRHPLDFREVKVEDATGMVKPLHVVYVNNIYGVARWGKDSATWLFHGYYNTAQRAMNAAKRVTKRCRECGLPWEFSALEFNQKDHLWYSITAAK
ncbi:MAG: hypothetical protein J6Q22_09520 [Prevotella sp.]|nr:hypothetical protein [Prevotella sp.]